MDHPGGVGAALQARPHGTLSFRLMEPMEEVVYLDHVKLMAVASLR